MSDFPIFLINLDGSDARLRAATAALQAQGAAFERHSAYDGRGKNGLDIPEYDAGGTLRRMGRALSGGEVGCFISHVEAAKRFMETGAAFGLVLEDDMSPTPQAFALTDALIGSGISDWAVAHLAAAELKTTTLVGRLNANGRTANVYRAHYFPMCTTALLWSRAGAEQFIRDAYPIICPVDLHLRHWTQKSDTGIAVAPGFFSTTAVASEIAASTVKRGGKSRTPLYTFKRLVRLFSERQRAKALQSRAQKEHNG